MRFNETLFKKIIYNLLRHRGENTSPPEVADDIRDRGSFVARETRTDAFDVLPSETRPRDEAVECQSESDDKSHLLSERSESMS